MIQRYANTEAGGNIGFYCDDIWDVTKIPTTAIKITEAQYQDAIANQGKYIIQSGSFVLTPAPTTAQQLQRAKDAKVFALKTNEATDLKTFKSSALGTPKTYLSDINDMILLNGEYSFVKGNDYDGKPITWYNVEDGNVPHSAAQFVQVFLDGRISVQTVKTRRATKEAQVGACTTQAALDTIAWPKNLNPPSIPVGLAGTAGTGQASLTWTANTDVTMLGGGGYNVYKDGVKVNTVLVTTPSYTVIGLTAGTTYQFAITAVDTDGNESAKTVTIGIKAN